MYKFRNKIVTAIVFSILLLQLYSCNWPRRNSGSAANQSFISIPLPAPLLKSNISIEEALLNRRSERNYKNEPLEIKDISQLLWAAQGITSDNNKGRTAPSAGALYPLELYLVSGNINTIPAGVYHYRPFDHSLLQIASGNKQMSLASAAHLQGSLNRSAAVIVITAEYIRTTRKYAERGIRYVQMEAGHAAQNICLQAVSLNIGTVTIGSFSDSLVKQILSIPETEIPLYLMPIGKKED